MKLKQIDINQLREYEKTHELSFLQSSSYCKFYEKASTPYQIYALIDDNNQILYTSLLILMPHAKFFFSAYIIMAKLPSEKIASAFFTLLKGELSKNSKITTLNVLFSNKVANRDTDGNIISISDDQKKIVPLIE